MPERTGAPSSGPARPAGARPRRFAGGRLVIASHNPGKVREIAELIAPLGVEAVSAATLGLAEPEETGDSFIANAELKAREAAQTSGLPALADDSGLVVPALEGAPGIYSARWAGPTKDFAIAITRVERELAARGLAPTGTAAYFICVLSLAWPDGHCDSFEGRERAASPSRRAARGASATTRSSWPGATPSPSARWSRRRSTPSATAPAPSRA